MMSLLFRAARRALLVLCVLGGLAGAQGYGFAPTALNMPASGSLSTQTTMVNAGKTPAKFTVLVRAWNMVGGQSVLADTRDLLVNPTEFTLAPGASQVIRVALRKKPGAQELTYRLFVQELPSEATARTTAPGQDGRDVSLDLTVAFSLPVYVTPAGAKSSVQATPMRDGADLVLTLTNSGTRRATYNGLVALRGEGRVALTSFAVLSGATYTLRLPGLGALSGALTLSYRNADGEDVRDTLPLP